MRTLLWIALAVLAAGCAARPTGSPSPAPIELPKAQALSALEPRLAQLESAAQRLQDVNAIERLQRAYGYYADRGAWNEAASLFSDAATLNCGAAGAAQGQARIRKYLLARHGGRPGVQVGQLDEHLLVQPVVHVSADGRTAQGRWREILMRGRYGQSAEWGDGVYENEYVKQNGVWKISRLRFYATFLVPYEGGWAKNPGGPWPHVAVAPLHYGHPVTEAAPEPESAEPPPSSDPDVTALRTALHTLQRHVRALEDENQIARLIGAYGYYWDKQRWTDLVNLFADDGSMEVSQRGVYVGKASIRRLLGLFGPEHLQPGHLNNHIQLQPVIHVAADGLHAQVRSRALSESGVYGKSGLWSDGVYENELVKEHGVWKLQSVHLYPTFIASYAAGWKLGDKRLSRVNPAAPPDRPPSVKYDSFPKVYLPPYHYDNPVTSGGGSELPPYALTMANPAYQSEIDRLNALAATVQSLEDARDIERLQRIYGYYLDKGQWREAADLFASDATLEVGGSGVFVGRERVYHFISWLVPRGLTRGLLFNHPQLQPVITLAPDGRTAKGRWHYLAETGEYERFATWGVGTEENEYVKHDGVWEIQSLHVYLRMYTPYEDGWGRKAIPNTRPEKKALAPDRPPTLTYETYPASFVPPPSFVNPVTLR